MEEIQFKEDGKAYGEIFINGREMTFEYKKGSSLKYKFDIEIPKCEIEKAKYEITHYLDKLLTINDLNDIKEDQIIIKGHGKNNVKFNIENMKTNFEILFTEKGSKININISKNSKMYKYISEGVNFQLVLKDEVYFKLIDYLKNYTKIRLKVMIDGNYRRKYKTEPN